MTIWLSNSSAGYAGFPTGSEGKASCLQRGRPGLNYQVGKIPRRRKRQPTPVLLPGKFRRRRSLVGYKCMGSQRVAHYWATSLLTSGYAPTRIESRDPRVHSGIIYKSQKVETTQIFSQGWVGKYNMVYTYNEILCVCVRHVRLCSPMDCSPPGSSFQDPTQGSCIPCTGRWILYHCAPWGAHYGILFSLVKKENSGACSNWVNLEDLTLSEINQRLY